MLRLAGREICKRLLEEWQDEGDPTAATEIEAACARILADPDLHPEALVVHIEEAARDHLEGPPGEVLTRLLTTLDEQAQQSLAQDDPGNWAKQAVTRMREWFGAGLGAAADAGEWPRVGSAGPWRLRPRNWPSTGMPIWQKPPSA